MIFRPQFFHIHNVSFPPFPDYFFSDKMPKKIKSNYRKENAQKARSSKRKIREEDEGKLKKHLFRYLGYHYAVVRMSGPHECYG